jgi:hypothetical protein
MPSVLLLGLLVFVAAPPASPAPALEGYSKCVPANVDLDSPVVVEDQSKRRRSTITTTVRSRLTQLRASCKKGKLFANRRQVYFYDLIGCWGNPPEDYLDLLKRQREEIDRLKKKYTVIQISCSDSSDRRRIS